MTTRARQCLQANRASMFGFKSRSSGWSSIADGVGHRLVPVGICYVLKTEQRKQYETQNDETSETDPFVDQSTAAEIGTIRRLHDGACNTGQLLGRVSHVSLRAVSVITAPNHSLHRTAACRFPSVAVGLVGLPVRCGHPLPAAVGELRRSASASITPPPHVTHSTGDFTDRGSPRTSDEARIGGGGGAGARSETRAGEEDQNPFDPR